MTIRTALDWASDTLKQAGYYHGQREAEILLADLISQDTAWLITHPDDELDSPSYQKFNEIITERLKGRPLSYILGYQQFLGWNFLTDARALIPRPETEQLVELIVRQIRQDHLDRGQFLEIGTGSGVIAISLKKYFPEANVTATDVSSEALELAEDNAKQLETAVDFLQSDLFQDVPQQKFDLIVANLPYVPSQRLDFTSEEILDWEPMVAVDGGDEGLKYLRPFLEKVGDYLSSSGLIGLEIWHTQGQAIRELVRKHLPAHQVEIVKDLAGYDRFALIKPREKS